MGDEAKINSRLIGILFPYNGMLNSLHSIAGGIALGGLAFSFCLFKFGYHYSMAKALPWTLVTGVGVFVVIVLIDMKLVSAIVGSARVKFDKEFKLKTAQRKKAIKALEQLGENWRIGAELSRSLSNHNFYLTDPTEAPPDQQLQNSLHEVLDTDDGQDKSAQNDTGLSGDLPKVNQVVRQPINQYAHIALQTSKKVVMKTDNTSEEEKFIMLEPERPPKRPRKKNVKET